MSTADSVEKAFWTHVATFGLGGQIEKAVREESERLHRILAQVDQLLQDDMGGFYESAPAETALAKARDLMRDEINRWAFG